MTERRSDQNPFAPFFFRALAPLRDRFEEFLKVGSDNLLMRFLKKELGDKYRYYEYFKKMSGMNGVYARMPYDILIN